MPSSFVSGLRKVRSKDTVLPPLGLPGGVAWGPGAAVDWLVGQSDTRLTDEKFKPDENFGECLFNCGSID